jgi:uncharacterized membrane protein
MESTIGYFYSIYKYNLNFMDKNIDILSIIYMEYKYI